MKTLFLLRHAKAKNQEKDQSDFDRVLSKTGYAELLQLAEIAKQLQVQSELVIASSAVRTTQTATFFSEALGLEASIIRSEFSLYNSGVGNYLNVINQIPESVNKALLVGHNPTISDLVNYLSDTYEVDLPTAGFVKLALLSDTWEGVGSGIASIEWVKVPENQI